jgi:phosphoglycolate phosphatase-like HAD superfamily hydrolase
MKSMASLRGWMLLCLWTLVFVPVVHAADPLPSWNDGPAKQAILEFVHRSTTAGEKDFVREVQRIATFDNDGTLWVEQPFYTQVAFAMDRVKLLAPRHPEWKTEEPFKTLLIGDREAISKMTLQDIEKIVAVTHSGMTVEAFQKIVTDWLARAKNPRFGRRYTELVYQPMIELMAYLRENGFKTYIVTGGGQEFVRAFAEKVYGVPPEQVIGTAGKTKYEYDANGKPMLIKLPEVLLVDDKVGKPVGINLIIGRIPHAAFGNSTGDQQMLEWTQAGSGGHLMMLVHHDDAEREYAYGADSKVGTFSDALMEEAKQRGWTVISMKKDWKRLFPFEALH